MSANLGKKSRHSCVFSGNGAHFFYRQNRAAERRLASGGRNSEDAYRAQLQQPKRGKTSKGQLKWKFVPSSRARGAPEPSGMWPSKGTGGAGALQRCSAFQSTWRRLTTRYGWQSCSCCGLLQQNSLLARNWPHTSSKRDPGTLRGFQILTLLEAHWNPWQGWKKQTNSVSQRAFTTGRACPELCSNIPPEVRTAGTRLSKRPTDRLIPAGFDLSPATSARSVLPRLSAQQAHSKQSNNIIAKEGEGDRT